MAAGVPSCQKITPSRLEKLTKMDNEAALRIKRSKKKFVSLPPVSNQETTNAGKALALDSVALNVDGSSAYLEEP
ncbi:hypothetical protein JHK85_051615 [Glycine max]|nr:hypothetical protein JHK85_051615 [Glycine max]